MQKKRQEIARTVMEIECVKYITKTIERQLVEDFFL